MILGPQRYLIELGPAFLPEPHYVHVFEVDGEACTDAGFDWAPDMTRALRFASRAEAEAFGHLHLDVDFLVTGHPASELVAPVHLVSEDEDDLLAAC